jgi:hypothetical protein
MIARNSGGSNMAHLILLLFVWIDACVVLWMCSVEMMPTPGKDARCDPTSLISTPTLTALRLIRENGQGRMVLHPTGCSTLVFLLDLPPLMTTFHILATDISAENRLSARALFQDPGVAGKEGFGTPQCLASPPGIFPRSSSRR